MIRYSKTKSHTSCPDAANACSGRRLATSGVALLCGVIGMTATRPAAAAGTWVKLKNPAPAGIVSALLMTDGTLLCAGTDNNTAYYKYTPNNGNYTTGTWSTMASTTYTRLFCSSEVLPNGNVYVAGAEYGNGGKYAEMYNYLANTWTVLPTISPTLNSLGDAISALLPNGNVLQGTWGSDVFIYHVDTNSFSAAATPKGNQDETAWVRLPNDNILTIDAFGQNAEHYVPSLNAWYVDGQTPANLYGYGGELGAGFVLPNGKAFYIGASSNTAIYTPGSTLTAAGTWAASATIPNSLGAVDAPACMMPNGNILCALGVNTGYGSSCSFWEYSYVSDAFTQVTSPNGGTSWSSPEFGCTMLQLPDGGVFFVGSQATTSNLYVYYPTGTALAQGQPTVSSYTLNSDGSYTLTGVGLNGISAGAAYGDDFQMNTNYPIVRLTDGSGNIYYCRTFNWSSTAIQNPNPVTTQFTLPAGLPSGSYTLQVVVNGNASAGTGFTTGGAANTVFFEAEALALNGESTTVSPVAATQYSGGSGDILYATGTGGYATYLLPNVQAGTYTVSVGMKKYTQRGIFQLSGSRADQITYSNIGSPVDEYSAGNGGNGVYSEMTVGTWAPGSSNNKLFNFAVTGKNASSTAYYLSVDYIRLTAQGTPPKAAVAPKSTTPKIKPTKPAKVK